MTRELSECLTFTVPLGSEPHRKAQQFTNSKAIAKAETSLSQYIGSICRGVLRCMGWETNWSASF